MVCKIDTSHQFDHNIIEVSHLLKDYVRSNPHCLIYYKMDMTKKCNTFHDKTQNGHKKVKTDTKMDSTDTKHRPGQKLIIVIHELILFFYSCSIHKFCLLEYNVTINRKFCLRPLNNGQRASYQGPILWSRESLQDR